MQTRFKLTPDNMVHLNIGGEAYTNPLEIALADIKSTGIQLRLPDLAGLGGPIPVVGFELTPGKMELILDNGWHYPMPENLQPQFQPFLDALNYIVAIRAAQQARLNPQPVEPENQA